MAGFSPILLGVTILFAGGALGVTATLSRQNRGAFVYAQLVLMAGIYVGFAIIALDAADFASRAVLSALLIESLIAIALIGGGLGVLASDRQWLLGVLILVHGGIDLGHLLLGAAHSPDAYEFLCIIYDGIVGVAAIWLLSDKTADS